MNVFYFSSDLYFGIAAVSIISMLENNTSIDEFHFYIADDGIKKENKDKLADILGKYNADVSYIPLPNPSELLDFSFNDRYQIGHSYPRMCLSRLLPEDMERVLVMDSDTLVLGDLGSLWNTNMGENILAGVADCINIKSYRKRFTN